MTPKSPAPGVRIDCRHHFGFLRIARRLRLLPQRQRLPARERERVVSVRRAAEKLFDLFLRSHLQTAVVVLVPLERVELRSKARVLGDLAAILEPRLEVCGERVALAIVDKRLPLRAIRGADWDELDRVAVRVAISAEIAEKVPPDLALPVEHHHGSLAREFVFADEPKDVPKVPLLVEAARRDELDHAEAAANAEGRLIAGAGRARWVDADVKAARRGAHPRAVADVAHAIPHATHAFARIARRLLPPPLRLGDRMHRENLAVFVDGELAADAHAIDRRVFAPLLALFLDPLARREPRDNELALDDVRRLLARDLDRLVELRFSVKRLEKLPHRPSRVGKQHDSSSARAVALDRLENNVRNARCLVDDEPQVPTRDPGDGFGFARRKSDDLAEIVRLEPSSRELPDIAVDNRGMRARETDSAAVGMVSIAIYDSTRTSAHHLELAPYDLVHLAGRRRAHNDARVGE